MPSLLDLRRTISALVAVAMSAALIAFAFIISDSFRTQTQTSARVSVGDAAVVVQDGRGAKSTEKALNDDLLNQVSALDGVASVRGAHWDMLGLDLPKQLSHSVGAQIAAQDVPALTKFTTLSSGRLPKTTGEVAIDSMLAEQQGLSVGDTIRLTSKIDDAKAVHSAPTVVGIISAGADSRETDTDTLYATAEQLQAMGARMDYRSLYVKAKPGTDASALLTKVSQTVHSVQPAASVESRDEAIAQRAQAQTGGTTIASIINLLAPVCAVVAIIVIATTFSTLVARQTRMVGLMRCIGTTRRQVMLAVLRTGLMTGVVGSVLGAALGTGLGAIAVSSGTFADLKADQLTISPVSLGLTVALGTLVTLIAVLRPARKATRISPLVALTGQVASTKQAGRKRMWVAVAGVIIAVIGAAIVALGIQASDIYITASGSAVVVVGTVLSLPLLVTAIIGFIGRVSRDTRLPVLQLATRNLARNSGRSAATAATLFVCVLVGSALFVGLSSLNASFDAILGHSSPVDARVFGVTPQTDTARLTEQVKAVDGVEDVTYVPTLDVTQTVGGESKDINVDVIDTHTVTSVVRSTSGLESLNDKTLIVGGIYDIPNGSTVTLTGAAGSVKLTARVQEGWGAVVSPAVAQRLNGDTPTNSTMWVRSTGSTMTPATERALNTAVRDQELMVNGSAAMTEQLSSTIMRMTILVSLVLGVALFIALSGLANTTDVSVLERTREIGVLRATGSSRQEIRRLIVTEGVLIAAVGGSLGLIIGASLGAAGTLAVGESAEGMAVHIPYLALLGMFAVTLAVGLAASVRPAGRAASVPPVRALSEE
ncbi:Macrolide export ATP-binding/permease protein MacB [Actinomyces naeslundii]|uniref:ABC transporter permease n=1 Tax=Actinomyces naeslundii TaxID=1655 RepID=UPI001958E73B|nr:FtsX-like permease family protein [Actinomyces naeslundii]VTX84285.1 Macrolide export ATP-binding/permease protein MacB [Actinomyces naeslundii]